MVNIPKPDPCIQPPQTAPTPKYPNPKLREAMAGTDPMFAAAWANVSGDSTTYDSNTMLLGL